MSQVIILSHMWYINFSSKHIDGLAQDGSNSIANALDLLHFAVIVLQVIGLQIIGVIYLHLIM